MVFLAVGSSSLFAQSRVLEEGFETTAAGSLPADWSQEPVAAAKKWAVERGNFSNPAACAAGTGRIKLVTGTPGANQEEVLLITPAFDNQRIAEPILIFDYASVRMNIGDKAVDSLKVYFRVRSDRAWTLLRSYGESDNWTRDTLDIPDKSKTMQIAFGGVDNGSFGVVLDNIAVTGKPVAQPVTNVEVYNKIHNEAKLRWSGSLAATYHVRIATQQLADPATATEADGLFLSQDVVSATAMRINAADNKALDPSTTYYYYIQTDLGYGDVSSWVKGQFTSACLPVESFATSFDSPDDVACWTLIGQGNGTYTPCGAPSNQTVYDYLDYINSEGEPGFYSWGVSPSAHTGASNLIMPVKNFTNYTEDYGVLYAVSPRLADNVNLKDMQLNFWMKSNSTQLHLRLLVSDWPDDFSNAKESGEIKPRYNNQYESYTVTFEDIESSGKYIAFKIDASEEKTSGQVCRIDIDDIELVEKAECSTATKVVMFNNPDVVGTSVILYWNRSGAQTYNVKISSSQINPAVDPGDVFDGNVTKPEIEISDLTPATRYFYYVQPVCFGGIKGTWSNVQTFDTECIFEGAPLPLRENFDNLTAGPALPPCWSSKNPAASAYAPAITASDYSKSLPNYLSLYSDGVHHIVLPKLNADLKDCQIRFSYSIDTKRIPLEVGIMTDPNDENTFVFIDDVVMTNSSSYNNYGWTNHITRFDSYTGSGRYVAFRITTPAIGFKLDDIIVELVPACAEPTGLQVVATDASSVTLDWLPSENGESEWEIAYVKAGGVFGNAVIKTGITAHPYQLDGLEENVTYDVYLRSVCSPSEKGIWIDPISAKTNAPAVVDYFCDFENESIAGAWNLLNGSQANSWIIGDAISSEQNAVTGAAVGRTLFISCDYGTSNSAISESTFGYATRLFDLNAGLLDFEFDWRMPGATGDRGPDYNGNRKQGTNGVIIPFLVPEDIIVQGGISGALYQLQSCISANPYNGIRWDISVPDGWIHLMDTEKSWGYLAAQDAEWHHYKYSYPLRKAGRYNLVIAYVTPTRLGNVSLKAAAVDNVAVKANTTDCIMPVDLVVKNITQSSADVAFLNYNATEWKYILTDSLLDASLTLDDVTSATGHVVSLGSQPDNPVHVTGLAPETPYYVYVRPACGADSTWTSISFRSICDAYDVPIAYSFDEPEFTSTHEGTDRWGSPVTVKDKTFMDCWRRIPETDFPEEGAYIPGSVVQTYKFKYEDIAATNSTQMLLVSAGYNGDVAYMASPELIPDIRALMMQFRVAVENDYTTSPQELEIGVMSDPLDPSTFETVETIKVLYAGQWKSQYIYFDGYQGTGKHMAMRMFAPSGRTGQFFIDDLKIDSIKGCIPAREITVSNVTASSADVEWAYVGAVGDYHVKVTTAPLGRWQDKANVFDDTIKAGNSLQLDHLRASKLYYVYVRTVCSEADGGGYSVGMSETTFRTSCPDKMQLPFFDDFDSYQRMSLPDCWHQVLEDGGSRIDAFSGTSMLGTPYKNYGLYSLVFQTGNNNLFPCLLALPEAPQDVRELSLSLKAFQMSGQDQLVVGVMSDVNDASTFVGLDTLNNAATYVWQDWVIDFTQYTGTGRYIAFYLETSYFGSAFYLDNILVRKAALTCPEARTPQVLEITDNSAVVRWADNPAVDGFEIKIASDEINPEIEEGDVKPATVYTDLQATVTGLQPATKYYLYMRHNCGSDEDVSYWTDPVVFRTACPAPESVPYYEDFSGYGDIADQGFFPECWRSRVVSYGSISPSIQPEPYIENAVRPSLFMKAVYDASDNAYAVVDAVTPRIEFGEQGVKGYMMKLAFKSNLAKAPIYVGLMSDPSDASTFEAYDTLVNNQKDVWENQIVNFYYHQGDEQYIAFRINSLDGAAVYNSTGTYDQCEGYQVNITDIEIVPIAECMPPFRVTADIRPNRAFISWMPGNGNAAEYTYYVSESQMEIPFDDTEFYGETMVTTDKTSVVLNGLEDWTSYYFYIKDNCGEFYPQVIDMSSRTTCARVASLEDLPVAPDFMRNGLGIGEEPEYSSYFDCWERRDSFEVATAYPYINDNGELFFHTELDSVCYAYLPQISSSNATLLSETQFRFSAKALEEGAKLVVGVAGHYTEGWPSVHYFEFEPFDTVELTSDYQEYVVKFEGYDFVSASPAGQSYNSCAPALTIVKGNGDVLVNEFSWEPIPHCFTPAGKVVSHDKTSFMVEWEKLDDQERWEVAYGKQGFDNLIDIIARTDTNYTVVNLDEGTPYEFYVRSNCGNGMTSEWGRICVTTDQTPAVYPYESVGFDDATFIAADDTTYFAYRTVEMPAGPHTLSFDWKVAAAEGAYLRVFTAPVSDMITADAGFGITETGAVPAGWSAVATLKGNTSWTAARHTLYVKTADAGAVNIVFVWYHAGDDLSEVVRNVTVGSSSECTVPDELFVSQITANSAALNWSSYNADSWDVQYYETELGETAAERIYDAVSGYVLSGLKADTEYTFRVASNCKAGQWSEWFTFRTICAAVDGLFETFDSELMPSCWSQYYGLFDEVVADPAKLQVVSGMWKVTDKVPVLGSTGGSHACLTITGDKCAEWLVSPAVKLDVNSALSFDLAFTVKDGQQAVAPLGQSDDRFIVAVSADEGKTWTREDAYIWNNKEDVNYRLNLIGNHSKRVEVDLSKYTGKTVRLAFYGESTVDVESSDIHIDSVRIDCRTVRPVSDRVCQGYSYYGEGFDLPKANLTVPGVYTFARVERAAQAGDCDVTVLLTLTVNESKMYEYTASICSDVSYSDQNFTGLTETGSYERAFPTPNGCDSTVVLHLTVNEAYEYDRTLTIDASQLPFKFACREFPVGTVSGNYVINCPTEAGCDSIINLTLTVTGGSAVNNVVKGDAVILTPNPVRAGEMITVNYGFDYSELDGLVVRVYNSLGQIVSASTPSGMPVMFRAPHVAGVYTVHVVTADERVLVGRFIVK